MKVETQFLHYSIVIFGERCLNFILEEQYETHRFSVEIGCSFNSKAEWVNKSRILEWVLHRSCNLLWIQRGKNHLNLTPLQNLLLKIFVFCQILAMNSKLYTLKFQRIIRQNQRKGTEHLSICLCILLPKKFGKKKVFYF